MFSLIFVDYLTLNQNIYRPDCIRGNLARDGPVLQGPQAYLTTLTREIALMIDHTLSFSQNRHPDYAVHVDYEKFFQAFTIKLRTQHEGGDGDQSLPSHMAESVEVDVDEGYGGIGEDVDEDFDVYALGAGDRNCDDEVGTESNSYHIDNDFASNNNPNNSRAGDGKLDDGGFYNFRTGDNGLDNSETGDDELHDSEVGDSKLDDSRMGVDGLNDYKMVDDELSDFRMGDGELDDDRMDDETSVYATSSVVTSGMNCIRPEVDNSKLKRLLPSCSQSPPLEKRSKA